MDAFEKVCKEYKITAVKHELTLACIKLEDTEKLQKIMDLSISIHGEMNSLYDLVFAFIECGKVRQAKKILETPGLRARHQRLENRCKRLLEENRLTELEQLVAITKDVFDIDRNRMFMYLFEGYRRKNDCDKVPWCVDNYAKRRISSLSEVLTFVPYLRYSGVTWWRDDHFLCFFTFSQRAFFYEKLISTAMMPPTAKIRVHDMDQ
ncbi:leucine-rich PPR motif-containing protein, mitochondrial-like [Macrobrachium nipponense]|uniref:leucine-rich PPR motif-containing protein, mitochondrial-like n=1 Tax=Macrobrachium nipponense TaxID=159736 RepID=UPI0030C7C207